MSIAITNAFSALNTFLALPRKTEQAQDSTYATVMAALTLTMDACHKPLPDLPDSIFTRSAKAFRFSLVQKFLFCHVIM